MRGNPNKLIPNRGQGVPNAGRKPSVLRKRMRGGIEDAMPVVEEVLKLHKSGKQPLSLSDALAIIDRLGKFGLGERQVTLEKSEVLEIALEVAIEYVPEARWTEFADKLGEALEDV